MPPDGLSRQMMRSAPRWPPSRNLQTPMPKYVAESFTAAEADVLRRYFTNLEQPVFALVNLPEVVKGALFARYSRTHKSLRRLFLDEFVGELDTTGDSTIDATIGLKRAEELYQRVFFEYGDGSVAQLGGVHLACEQASNLLTKVLEWGRLMAYLEQSTRYIPYDNRLGGRYRYYRDPDILGSALGTRYVGDLDRLFDIYAEALPVMQEWVRARYPKASSDSDFVYRQSVKAKALDALRGILPAASLSNVGIYGTGQGYEALLLRMRANPLPEARAYAEMMLTELRKVIPSFLTRVDRPDRGGAWSAYLTDTRAAMEELAGKLFAADDPEPRPGYAVPPAVEEAGLAERYHDAMERSASLYDTLVGRFPAQAPYAVSLAYRVRYAIQLNAREAMHMLELRTTPQGHPDYRAVCQEMHRLIATQAGHPLVAEMMRFVDHGTYDLERLDAERRAEARRTISG